MVWSNCQMVWCWQVRLPILVSPIDYCIAHVDRLTDLSTKTHSVSFPLFTQNPSTSGVMRGKKHPLSVEFADGDWNGLIRHFVPSGTLQVEVTSAEGLSHATSSDVELLSLQKSLGRLKYALTKGKQQGTNLSFRASSCGVLLRTQNPHTPSQSNVFHRVQPLLQRLAWRISSTGTSFQRPSTEQRHKHIICTLAHSQGVAKTALWV